LASANLGAHFKISKFQNPVEFSPGFLGGAAAPPRRKISNIFGWKYDLRRKRQAFKTAAAMLIIA
jgi:hypothetical protein